MQTLAEITQVTESMTEEFQHYCIKYNCYHNWNITFNTTRLLRCLLGKVRLSIQTYAKNDAWIYTLIYFIPSRLNRFPIRCLCWIIYLFLNGNSERHGRVNLATVLENYLHCIGFKIFTFPKHNFSILMISKPFYYCLPSVFLTITFQDRDSLQLIGLTLSPTWIFILYSCAIREVKQRQACPVPRMVITWEWQLMQA